MRSTSPRPAAASRGKALSAAAAIGFSLTFVGAGIAMLVGIVPSRTLVGSGELDTSVVLLFVPLCALVFALLVEVARTTMAGGLRQERPRPANPLAAWRPGNGEG